MKISTIYIADDGSKFAKPIDCLTYELMGKEIEIIMRPLGARNDSCEFANGGGYYQHESPHLVKIELAKYLLKKQPDLKAAEQIVAGENIDMSWLESKEFKDHMGNYMNKAIFRLSCINYTSGREYGQPYFASHESECKQVDLGKVTTQD
jgi:hypothetical protein